LSQSIQPAQRILNISPASQLLQIFLWTHINRQWWLTQQQISSLARLWLISFVAIPRIDSTSTMIFTMMSVIPTVGGTSIYVSSLRKKFSICSKTLVRASWLAEAALTALESWAQY
jgi:hypothetical protein